ncbi:Hypothetical protein, putative [Bodo saltans]|uniref:Uncharacterized protein n=1 Tax=Bodo saltans TaxID=75058 RepID=A0A0S4J2H6_BODSA|nr:Hypothetical protein, putative [Bodo saltans]|eukprot:CUG55958.1 Hypothetical protein, putative [Bodo saltans]
MSMSTNGTRLDAVYSFSIAIREIMSVAGAHVKDTLVSPNLVGGIARMSTYATTPDAVRLLSGAIRESANRVSASVQAMFATSSIVDASVRMSTYAKTPDSVRRHAPLVFYTGVMFL